jgi:hypothetical protein
MKSSNEWPNQAIEYAKNRIVQFTQSPLKDAHFFQGYLDLSLAKSGHFELDDFIPSLLAKAESDKLAFITAKRICAHFETNNQSKPRELSVWLSNVLVDINKEPKNGRTGPNKSQTEHLFLLGLVATIASDFSRPVYPSVSTGDDGSVLGVVAKASSLAKKETGKVIFPSGSSAMKNRYIRSKKILSYIPKISAK